MIDHNKARQIHEAVRAALGEVCHDFDLKIMDSRCSFGSGTIGFKIQMGETVDFAGADVNPDKVQFERDALFVGANPNWFGKSFGIGGVRYTVTGLRTRNRAYPIMAQRYDGRQFKFTVSTVLSAIEMEERKVFAS